MAEGSSNTENKATENKDVEDRGEGMPYINVITEEGATGRRMHHIVYGGITKYFYRSTGGGNPRFGNAYQGVFVPVYGMLKNGELVKAQTLLDINRIHGGNQERKWLIANNL